MAPIFNFECHSESAFEFAGEELHIKYGQADPYHTGERTHKGAYSEGSGWEIRETDEDVTWVIGDPLVGIPAEASWSLEDALTWIVAVQNYDGEALVKQSAEDDGESAGQAGIDLETGESSAMVYYRDTGLGDAHNQGRKTIESVLTAIRIVKDARLWCPAIITRWDKYGAFTFLPEQYDRIPWKANAAKMGSKDFERLQQILTNMTGGHASAARFQLALRRFNGALDRPNMEDGIIDLCIALEAALSTDPNVKERGEYLEKKASSLLKTRRETGGKPTVADHYWVRNQIVHGTGKRIDVEETFSALAGDVRRILFEMLMRPELIDLLSEGGPSKN